jgi:hypothetical protein
MKPAIVERTADTRAIILQNGRPFFWPDEFSSQKISKCEPCHLQPVGQANMNVVIPQQRLPLPQPPPAQAERPAVAPAPKFQRHGFTLLRIVARVKRRFCLT